MLAHFARLGGILIRPRSTLLAIVLGEDEAKAWHVFPWIAVVAAASAPVETGRAVLLLRVDALAGIWTFFAMVADRAGPGLVGAVLGAFVLQLTKVQFDRAFDGTMYMLAPYLLLTASGALLSALGVELWFMPHRRLTGVPWVVALRAVVAYGWSLALFVVVLVGVTRGSKSTATAGA